MPELSARSTRSADAGWHRPLPAGPVVLSGGTPTADQLRAAGFPPDAVCWDVGWDEHISTPHALIEWAGDRLQVRRRTLPRPTTNPVLKGGVVTDAFHVWPGEPFSIANTAFVVVGGRPAEFEDTITRDALRAVAYSDPAHRLAALARLPEAVRAASTDDELAGAVAEVLLAGVPGATAVAVVRLDPDTGRPTVRAARGPDVGLVPSAKLVRAAVAERRETVLHVWTADPGGADEPTRAGGADWAACVPLHDDRHSDWGVYLAGRLGRRATDREAMLAAVRAELKFAELAADLFAALRSVAVLQRRAALLARFLSPTIHDLITADGGVDEQLAPRTVAVTVLFCDLRGSARVADEEDDPAAAWATVSAALQEMSTAILETQGVIGDFQGDAAVGFWGWPVADDPTRDPQLELACRAALTIRNRFARAGRQSGFACGVGLAHGPAMAGRIGLPDQYKVGVFGRPVNLASRLEGLSKRFGVPIVADETVAGFAQTMKGVRVRRLARVLPAGMTRPVAVSELLPPAPDGLSEIQRLDYQAALDHFQAGRWEDARRKLDPLAKTDGPSRFLLAHMAAIPAGPPAGWDGIVRLDGK